MDTAEEIKRRKLREMLTRAGGASSPSSPAAPVEVDAGNLEELLRRERAVILDFYSEWCQPCRMLAPVLREVAEKLAGRVTVAKINANRNAEASIRYGVRGVPTLIFFRDGREVHRVVGFIPGEEIMRLAEKLLVD